MFYIQVIPEKGTPYRYRSMRKRLVRFKSGKAADTFAKRLRSSSRAALGKFRVISTTRKKPQAPPPAKPDVFSIHFATTEDEIVSVYERGPSSCMKYKESACNSYSGPGQRYHPVRVYAAGDLAIAYMKRNGRITARAVCWPAKKVYTRVYGDDIRFHEHMKKLGYRAAMRNDKALHGARIKRVPRWSSLTNEWMSWSDGGISHIVPSIDWHGVPARDQHQPQNPYFILTAF